MDTNSKHRQEVRYARRTAHPAHEPHKPTMEVKSTAIYRNGRLIGFTRLPKKGDHHMTKQDLIAMYDELFAPDTVVSVSVSRENWLAMRGSIARELNRPTMPTDEELRADHASDPLVEQDEEIERLRAEVRALRIGHGFKDPDSLDAPAAEPLSALPESLRDPIKVLERGRELLAKHEAITRSAMYEFLGWLSGDIPELHAVEVPRLADSWERYRAKIDEMPTEKSAVAGPSTYTALNYVGKGPLPDCDECHQPYRAHGEMDECPPAKSPEVLGAHRRCLICGKPRGEHDAKELAECEAAL